MVLLRACNSDVDEVAMVAVAVVVAVMVVTAIKPHSVFSPAVNLWLVL
jgi:hypothetical protein